MSEKYVLWLSDKQEHDVRLNAYGYWAGKDYTCVGELFPITDSRITKRTKVYSSRKRAENALNAALNRNYAYVIYGRIEPLESEVQNG